MPENADGAEAYVRDGIETKLTHGPDLNLIRKMAKPAQLPIPGPVWSVLRRLSRHPVETVLFGPAPSTVRRRLGIRWTAFHEAEYQAVLGGLRTAPALLPDRLRMQPYAYRALHPQAA